MSGDVQPRRRKDKKKKKDDLGVEEPRGTAATLGEGDVFMHSQHDHGTGGHWCAKIIFFSLLAVLITLVGLIILENRGLTELEANSVESRYSGVLEGWLEDTPDDDHHDEHTLELKHPDDEIEEHDESDLEDEEGHDLDEEHEDHEDDEEHEEDEEEDEIIDSNEVDGDDEEHQDEKDENEDDNDESVENLDETDDEEVDEKIAYSRYSYDEQKYNIDDNDDDDEQISRESQEIEEEDDKLSKENDDDQNEDGSDDEDNQDDSDDEDNQDEQDDEDGQDNDENYIYGRNKQDESAELDEENLEHDDDEPEDEDEIEKIEREFNDDDEGSEEVPLKSSHHDKEDEDVSKEDATQEEDEEDEDFLEADDDEPPVERITTPPAGKPFVEIEEETIVKPIDTLAEEEEYERKQEELRREEAEASHMWLKLAVGGALLAATHAVLRRATARDAPEPEPEEPTRQETAPMPDRRMTLVSEEPSTYVAQRQPQPAPRSISDEHIFKKPAPVVMSAPITKQDIEREVNEKKTLRDQEIPEDKTKDEEEKELYSDDEEIEEEEEEEEEDIVIPTKITTQQKSPILKTEHKEEESEPEEVPDDVEIIDDEQIEEEEEEEEQDDEEEISDVDDTELLSRLEAKYGRLPEPERPGKHKEGGNSIEDEWPGEPSQSYWREQLDIAEEELRQGAWAACERRAAASALADSGRARWIAARALDGAAEAGKDNRLLSRAIAAYIHLLKMNERLSDAKLLEVARRAIDRIQFRGTYLSAEPIYRLLIRRFPHDVNHRNNLTVTFLMANRADLASEVLQDTLRLWPNDRVALAHHGFVMKNHYNNLEEAVVYLQRALEDDAGPPDAARFYYHLGDALLQLGRPHDAQLVHARAAALGHFLSAAQRSLYNVPRLRGRPWWPVEDTPYAGLARALERSWRDVLREGEEAGAAYEREKEGLMERGEWSQLELFVRGREVGGRCARAPVTCALVRSEPAAAGCRRGQVKFSAMRAGTHVRAHVGPTNCRLRLHLALSNTDGTYIRVHNETRQWRVGKTFIFDDSFEHEVWHNGTGTRIVLIVDLWHPDLTAAERRQLPAI
ncbi:aspartyl/asparaginyl beta-hydroxylase [Vanessa atalanta]|uniref:aspartyl/asparaginyl beta-hydroxylase n=1 Tax=Vanessa atalanta TaxID=42275 RepID=UPI001FCD697B|nr:aspartyl/asparaginyl beta-hydroxylase [Vanessa atalanta]